MKNILLLLALSVMTFAASAQEVTDYIITLKGDTLKGPVKLYSNGEAFDRVTVVDNNGKKNNFTSLQVRTVFQKGITYRAVKQNNTLHYMKLIKSGPITLYGFKAEHQTTYDGYFLVKKNGESLEAPNMLGFKKMMSDFTAECPVVSDAIKDETLKRADLMSIVDRYNNCIAPKPETPVATAASVVPAPAQPDEQDPKILAIDDFRKKVEALQNFPSRKNVTDLLQDITGKVKSKQTVWNYQIEALKGYFSGQESMKEDLDQLIATLTKS